MDFTEINGTRFFNLTPHAINAQLADGTSVRIDPAGQVARAAQVETADGSIAGFNIARIEYGSIEGLPKAQENCVYILSSLAAQAVQGRDDVLVPGPAIRDGEGRIVGCRGFCRI